MRNEMKRNRLINIHYQCLIVLISFSGDAQSKGRIYLHDFAK